MKKALILAVILLGVVNSNPIEAETSYNEPIIKMFNHGAEY